MNHLEQLKKQLMVKPTVQEREKVAVVIKGETKEEKKPKKPKAPKTITEKLEEGVIDLGEQISEIQKVEGILPVDIDIESDEENKKKEKDEKGRPTIIDKTQDGFDRAALLKKLAESKKTVVVVKPTVEIKEKIIEPIPAPITKKAKKIEIKRPLIIEDEDEEEKPKKDEDEE